MERISRGEIWIVEPASHPKPRPALIISINPVNDLCPDILLIPITTKPGPLRIQLSENSEKTGLMSESYAKCESLGPVHKSRLKRKIGRLSHSELKSVDEGVKKVLGIS
ncbi:MAG: type II toxin-antitoxin system PemK/MazF family toxin [Nitrospirae bacterium]|nr:type II toxin-antitoxin system PemK/MazF family toxin [Nitrospirota bacterium]